MIAGLPLSFAEPLLLLGLLSLPVLWWLLRVMPPRPRRVEFPPTRLLFDIAPKEETPSRTPWWLTALRLLAAALVILAAAGPVWNPQTGLAGKTTPLLILWGTRGNPPTQEYPTVWRKFASNLVDAQPLPTGHALQVEAPDAVYDHFVKFFTA